MSRRTNFLDGNDNFREQNLRFVRNEFEDNMNQFFGGAKGGPGMSQQQQQKPPARDSLIVQPTPGAGGPRRGAIIGTGNPEVDQRRQFLRQLGVNRNKARSMVKRSFKVPNFNLRDFQRKRFRLSVELGDNRQKEVDAIIIREFFDFIDANEPRERPRTPSPPRNINWNDDPNSPSPCPGNAILDDTFPREAFERNEEERRFARSRSPDVDRHGTSNDRWQQQQQDDFPQSNNRNSNFQFDNRRIMDQNENDNFRQQGEQIVDVDRNYRQQERFNLTNSNEDLERTNRSRQMEETYSYSPRQMQVNRSLENINDNYNNNNNFERDFGNSDFTPHAREWDRNQDFRGDFERNLDDRNPETRNADYEPGIRNLRQLSPPRRNLNPYSFHNKEPNYQRFVQMDDGNEDRVFLIRDPDCVDMRSNQFHDEQRNFMGNHSEDFEEGRYNDPNHQHFLNNDEEFQRSDNFRQNFGPGNGDDRHSNFLNNDRPNEFLQDRNERNFNNNYNNRQEILNDDPSDQFENDRFNNQQRRGQNLDGNDFHRNDEAFGNFPQRPDNDRFNMQERDGGPPIRSQPDNNNFQRNQSFQQNFSSNQRDRRVPLPSNANRYQGNIQSKRNEPRNNSRGGGPQRTGRMDRPNPVTATSQQTVGRRPPPPATRTGNKNSAIGGAPLVGKSQARVDITNANRNQVGNRANVRPPIAAQTATNSAENKANSPRTGQKRASEPPASSRLTIAELKQRKIDGKQRVFRIAGFEFPYMSGRVFRLPQPESESYALTFFEQKPNYFTNYLMEYLGDEGQLKVDNYNDDDEDKSEDDESIEEGPRNAGGKHRRYLNKRIRQSLQREWINIYRKSNYKYWHIWWKDYKWCGAEIEKQLETFDNISVKHRFIPIYPNATNEKVVNNVLKRAETNLAKNNYNHFHVMRTIFIIMNETFLENLSKNDVKQLQDIIRYIPNNQWLFKMRSMVYLWERHYAAIKKGQKEANAVRRQWKNPSFHWLAKQAFDELKTISEIAWPDHKKLFDG